MANATKPDFFANLPSLKKEKATKAGATEDEQALAYMSDLTGWKVFKKEADRLIDEMDQMIEVSVSKGLSREEIGENTIVVSLAKGVIRRLMNKVSDAKEACGEAGGK